MNERTYSLESAWANVDGKTILDEFNKLTVKAPAKDPNGPLKGIFGIKSFAKLTHHTEEEILKKLGPPPYLIDFETGAVSHFENNGCVSVGDEDYLAWHNPKIEDYRMPLHNQCRCWVTKQK